MSETRGGAKYPERGAEVDADNHGPTRLAAELLSVVVAELRVSVVKATSFPLSSRRDRQLLLSSVFSLILPFYFSLLSR